MTPDPTEPTSAKADSAPVSANEPQRSAEVQAAIKWFAHQDEGWDEACVQLGFVELFSLADIDPVHVKAGGILRAEVLRLEAKVEELNGNVALATAGASSYKLRCLKAESERSAILTERDKLREEVEVLRSWGNKDCTAMADAELERRRSATTPKGAAQP